MYYITNKDNVYLSGTKNLIYSKMISEDWRHIYMYQNFQKYSHIFQYHKPRQDRRLENKNTTKIPREWFNVSQRLSDEELCCLHSLKMLPHRTVYYEKMYYFWSIWHISGQPVDIFMLKAMTLINNKTC